MSYKNEQEKKQTFVNGEILIQIESYLISDPDCDMQMCPILSSEGHEEGISRNYKQGGIGTW